MCAIQLGFLLLDCGAKLQKLRGHVLPSLLQDIDELTGTLPVSGCAEKGMCQTCITRTSSSLAAAYFGSDRAALVLVLWSASVSASLLHLSCQRGPCARCGGSSPPLSGGTSSSAPDAHQGCPGPGQPRLWRPAAACCLPETPARPMCAVLGSGPHVWPRPVTRSKQNTLPMSAFLARADTVQWAEAVWPCLLPQSLSSPALTALAVFRQLCRRPPC